MISVTKYYCFYHKEKIFMDRMKELVELLNKYAYQYYVLDEPTVSDVQYDVLYNELLELEKESGTVLPDSPTKKIGGDPIKAFTPHTHINKLYSLDKCNSFEELRAWDGKLRQIRSDIEYTVEYKLDGLTLCLTYEDGLLKCASTRGNGEVGEDVTAQVLTVKSVPTRIPYTETVEVQGEGIMRLSAFNKYNETAAEPLKNARNGVAGAIRNLDPKVTASRNLDVIFYNVNYTENGYLSSQEENIEFLKNNRFKTEKLFVTSDIEEVISYIASVDRSSLDFLIDGMVVKVNSVSLREELGYTEKFPRWAMAYKFEAEETSTRLLDVEWNVGRTGKLTPLAILSPVELCGVTVKRATLNNYGDILRKKVRIGSNVFIRRSNDVIPEILGIAEDFEDSKEILPPTHCPSCGSELYENGAHIFCPNEENCLPQIIGRLEHFCSKDCMDIRGISESTITQIVKAYDVKEPTDLYKLTREQIATLEGFKDKKTDNFIASVEKSKSATLASFINAIGIENVGKKAAKDLAERFCNVDALAKATKEELLAIDEVGEIMADCIIGFFASHSALIEEFKAIGINPQMEEKVKTEGVFSGLKVVLTGTLSAFPRSFAAKEIEARGGEVMSSVTKLTDLVIVGEDAGSKKAKAEKLGIKIINEQEFLKLL